VLKADHGPCRLYDCLTLLIFTASLGSVSQSHAAEPVYDVVIYGGTSAGVSAAIQTKRMGKSVILIEPGKHLGGLTVSGLGATDSGDKSAIGGISREFYQRVRQHYTQDSAWRQEAADQNGSFQQKSDAMWTFEPHVAERIFLDWLKSENVPYVLEEALNRETGVRKENGRIQSITMKSGKQFSGRRFIDATYEGDLFAAAGVSYTVGREANSQYGESLNGIQVGHSIHHQFVAPVDPYRVPGNPQSGLLPGIRPDIPGPDGAADDSLQAYNFRICMTDAEENRVPFNKPAGYDPLQHELLLRNFEAGDMRLPMSIGRMPNRKTDLNNNFAVSTDWIGMNHNYADADDDARAQILKDHETYVRGFLWTLANHPRVPEEIRAKASRWGYSKDEFVNNNYFPFWCYIREARRMIGTYVQTEQDCRRIRICEDSVGLGSYNMDSHNCLRYVDATGHVRNEGDVQVSPRGAYAISYRALLPKQEECENLAVPVCISCTHIAYGSIRMEPVFMVLGQSAATACCLSLEGDQPLHAVSYSTLQQRLLADNQVLDLKNRTPAIASIQLKDLPGIVVDDADAQKVGEWSLSSSVPGFVGHGYLAASSKTENKCSVTYSLTVPETGRYALRMSYTPAGNRATNTPVVWEHRGTSQEKKVNQRATPPADGMFYPLAELACESGEIITVTISNDQVNGHVIADTVQLVPLKSITH